LDFIRETGPLVATFIGDIVDAFVALSEAMRPLAPLALRIGSFFLELFTLFMGSPLGPVIMGFGMLASAISFAIPLVSLFRAGWGILKTILTPVIAVLGKVGAAMMRSGNFARLFFAAIRLGSGPIGWLI